MGILLRNQRCLLAGIPEAAEINLQCSLELRSARVSTSSIRLTEEKCDPILWTLRQSYRS